MFLARPLLTGVMLCRPSSAPLCRASTSSARHFCLFGRRLTRSEMKEPVREQLQNVLSKNKEGKEPPRADTIPPRPLRQMLIKSGCFYFMTNTLFFTAALMYDHKTAQYTFQWAADKVGQVITSHPQLNALDLRTAATNLVWALIGANVAVFLLWKVPALKPTMCRYFTSSVASKSLYLPMFLSMFSHRGPLHLFINMYVLKNFAIAAIGLLGPAQFMAMFLSGGMFGGLLSLWHKAFMASAIPSFGASGAICAVIGYVCSKFPDQPVRFIFLPMFSFSAKYGLYGLLAFETVCLLRILPLHRLILLGHAAHIGGLLFGMYYAHYGQADYMKVVWMRFVALQMRLNRAKMNVNGTKSEEEEGTTNDGLTTPKQQQQNNAFRKIRQHLIDELKTQQNATDKKHEDWAQTMAEQKEAEKDRIRRNREARERRKEAAKSGSVDEDGDD
uniref:rhomboid protease n=1 Tax=Globodera rostochiensis TaxID=31243 RepID=A0A914HMS2_GLORO